MAVYLGQILKNLQHRVLIADLTESCGLQYLFSVSEKFPITYQGVDYIGHEFHAYSSGNDAYDYIIVCMAKDIRRYAGNRLAKIYYISDTEYDHIVNMICEIRNARIATGIILRDVTENGISGEHLLKFIFCDDYLLKMYQEGRVFQIPDDLTDREYRIGMQYGDFGEFKYLSAEYLKVLEMMARDITGCQKAAAVRSLKYAKEGKNIEEYRILEQRFRKKRN